MKRSTTYIFPFMIEGEPSFLPLFLSSSLPFNSLENPLGCQSFALATTADAPTLSLSAASFTMRVSNSLQLGMSSIRPMLCPHDHIASSLYVTLR